MTESDRFLTTVGDSRGRTFPLLVLPYAGGGTRRFGSWADELPPNVELGLVHLPGRESRIREEAFRRMDALVEALCDAIGPRLPDRFGIFGHSMGALIAFAFARGLRDRGLPQPTCLFVSGRRAPGRPSRFGPIRDLPRNEFVEAIGSLGGLPPALLEDEELLDLFLPTLRADLALCETYEFEEGSPLSCGLFVYRGEDDEFVTASEARAWKTRTTGPTAFRTIGGGHFFIEENEEVFLQHLDSDLASVREEGATARTDSP